MKFASLGSGSSGNATLIASDSTKLLVDCGFAARETTKRLKRLDIEAETLNGIVVTHEHGDHIKGVAAMSRKYDLPVYLTYGTFKSRDFGRLPAVHIIDNYQPFNVGDIHIQPVAVPHDASEPAQYIVEHSGLRIGVLTDLGYITSHIIDQYNACDAILVEANHDSHMLSTGPYPSGLKARVGGNWGHLNNLQTVQFLENINHSHLQHLVVGHISKQNNAVDTVKHALHNIVNRIGAERVIFACQDEGFDWLELCKENIASSSTKRACATTPI